MSAILDVVSGFESIVDKFIPDPKAAAELKLELFKAQQAIPLAEAQSNDKWTSRARPMFMYVMYIIMLSCIPMSLVYAINPSIAHNIAIGLQEWLGAIPKPMWSLFGIAFGTNAIADAHIAQPFFGGK